MLLRHCSCIYKRKSKNNFSFYQEETQYISRQMVEKANANDVQNILELISTLKCELNWDLNAKGLTDDDIRILAMELESNEHCHVLHLHLNNITDKGMLYLAEMLKKNRTLTDLYLGANDIGNQGAEVLCHALAGHNRTLVVVDLTCNRITDESTDFIVELLKTNNTLMGFMLTSNMISDEGKSKLQAARNIRDISFGNNI